MIRHPSSRGPRVLLGVTGGIAAYKAAELARRLQDAGAEVQVAMTASARRFVAPLTFQALTGHPVRTELWDESAEAAMGHIELARWPDLILVAPASAHFLARLAHGLADDLLTTLCLASDRPLFVAPAMNRLMWASAATQANMTALRARGVRVLGPESGDQACGEVGEGRMSEPEKIAEEVLSGPGIRDLGPGETKLVSGCKIVVTAGPTREAIDPVRVISNRSSGKMGFALAQAFARLGADVTLVTGPVALTAPAGVKRIDAETATEMLDAALAAARGADVFIGAAAVSDYRPAGASARKIKKKETRITLELERTEDILSAVRKKFPKLFIVGFAAETEDLEANARAKLTGKRLDLIAANLVGGGRAFDRDDNTLHVYWSGGSRALGTGSKTALAQALAELIVERYSATPKKATGT